MLANGGGALLDRLGRLLKGDEVEATLLLLVLAGDLGNLDLLGLALLGGLGDGHLHSLLTAVSLNETKERCCSSDDFRQPCKYVVCCTVLNFKGLGLWNCMV